MLKGGVVRLPTNTRTNYSTSHIECYRLGTRQNADHTGPHNNLATLLRAAQAQEQLTWPLRKPQETELPLKETSFSFGSLLYRHALMANRMFANCVGESPQQETLLSSKRDEPARDSRSRSLSRDPCSFQLSQIELGTDHSRRQP